MIFLFKEVIFRCKTLVFGGVACFFTPIMISSSLDLHFRGHGWFAGFKCHSPADDEASRIDPAYEFFFDISSTDLRCRMVYQYSYLFL